jgi:hypothetical protein
MGNSDYRISIQPGYVLVERPEDYEIASNKVPAMLMEMSVFCKDAGCQKVLILGPKTKVDLSTLDIYDLGEQISELHLQIAVVESHDASDDDESFLETVVFNRGGPLQFFHTKKEAEDWLENS